MIYAKGKVRFAQDDDGTCKDCGEYDRVNADLLCVRCAMLKKPVVQLNLYCGKCAPKIKRHCKNCLQEKDVIFDDNMCADCKYGDSWEEDPQNGLRQSTCALCKKRRYLDENGLCKTCYKGASLAAVKADRMLHPCEKCGNITYSNHTLCSNCRNKARECLTCGKVFTPSSQAQLHCHEHLPKCLGCEKTFVPYSKVHVRCNSCESDALNNVCLKCHRDNLPLNTRGRCEGCDPDPPKTYSCALCKVYNVEYEGTMCITCAGKKELCLYCGIESIYATEFLCNTCLTKNNER